jgi:hypothetical protein
MPRHRCLPLPALAFAAALIGSTAAMAADTSDPIGQLRRIARYDAAQKIDVGQSPGGLLACYFREEGSSHRLDIGVTGSRAFLRLEAPDDRDATPAPPLNVFAGKSGPTDDYILIKNFDGAVRFTMPRPERSDFVLIAETEPRDFLQMVAAARGEFVVVQSRADPKAQNIVAIYHFSAKAIAPLLACAAERTAATAPPAAAAPEISAAQSDWASYANARFGTWLDYPSDLFSERDPAPLNNDGRTFRSRDGRARLSVHAMHNVEADTPQRYLDKYLDDKNVSFRRVTPNFFAVSGRNGADIYYRRCNFAGLEDGTIHCFEISYPAAEKAAFDPIVERIGKSLRVGTRQEGN